MQVIKSESNMNQKKARLLKKLARSLGLPYKVIKKRYQSFNSMQRDEMAQELKRIQKASL